MGLTLGGKIGIRGFFAFLLALMAAVAPMAEAHEGHGADSFEGSCELAGTTRFGRPIFAFLTANVMLLTATGSCDGTLIGDAAPASHAAKITVLATGIAGCFAQALTGMGALTLGQGGESVTIDFTMDSFSPALFSIKGAGGGDGLALTSSASSPEAIEACFGSGFSWIETGVRVQTITPLEG